MRVLLIMALNMEIKARGRERNTALIIIFAFLLYLAAVLLLNAGMVELRMDALGSDAQIYFYLMKSPFKTVCIVMMALSAACWGN